MRSGYGYQVKFFGVNDGHRRELVSGRDFRFDESGFSYLGLATRHRERDLLRVGVAVFAVDRIVRRYRRAPGRGLSREVVLEIQVTEPAFWNRPQIRELISQAIHQVSDDFWEVSFVQRERTLDSLPLFPLVKTTPTVCLYSTGLDSAAGLGGRLRDVDGPVLCVTACHQPGQRMRMAEHLRTLQSHYRKSVFPVSSKAALIGVPMKEQELSQRCRALLFLAMGGVAASLAGSDQVEVYENGIGAMNLPPMAGMLVGGRATKGCHPEFLRLMGRLVSHVAERPVSFELPYRFSTKAEMVRGLADDGLSELAFSTVSCVHFPLRRPGTEKQCGVCPACIGRRQAFLAAGVEEPISAYRFDVFGSGAGDVPASKLLDLKAALMQVADLSELEDDGRKPDLFRRHLFGTHVLSAGETVTPWIDVHRRYRDEWLRLLDRERTAGVSWASWVSGECVAV